MKSYVAFVDAEGKEHVAGSLVWLYFEQHDNGATEKLGEPIAQSIEEIMAMVKFVQAHCPDGWDIIEGEIVKL